METVAPVWDVKAEAAKAKLAVTTKARAKFRDHGTAEFIPGIVEKPKRAAKVKVERADEVMPHGGSLKRRRAVKVEKDPPAKAPPKPYVTVTPEIYSAVLDELSTGVPLMQICSRIGMPSVTGIRHYREGEDLDPDDPRSPDIRSARLARYARARKDFVDALVEESLVIADDGTNDWMEREREDGRIDEVIDKEHIQRSKLRIETRFKFAGLVDPKRYGPMLKLADPDAKPLGDAAARSNSDMAIGLAKIFDAGRRAAGLALPAPIDKAE